MALDAPVYQGASFKKGGLETRLPYTDISELPASVRHHLPEHAQEIYLATFNNAWREYADRPDHEAIAHKVAWAAVKREYAKVGSEWVKK